MGRKRPECEAEGRGVSTQRYSEGRQRSRRAFSGPPFGRHGIGSSASSRSLDGSTEPVSRYRSSQPSQFHVVARVLKCITRSRQKSCCGENFRRKMGRLGKDGEKIFRRPVDPSKPANCTQPVFVPSLMGEMAADRVGKARYFGN